MREGSAGGGIRSVRLEKEGDRRGGVTTRSCLDATANALGVLGEVLEGRDEEEENEAGGTAAVAA